jgi:hypothetical protein
MSNVPTSDGNTAFVYTRIDWGEFCVLSFNFHEKVSAVQIGFE